MSKKQKKNKLKLQRKIVIILLPISFILIILGIIMSNKPVKAGIIKNGKVIYSEKINNVSFVNNNPIIELKSVNEQINNIVIDSEMVEDMKKNSSKYNQTLKEILKDTHTSENDIYNVKTAINLKIVDEKDYYKDYYVKITGFDNVGSFIKFCEDAFKLVKEEMK